MTKFQGLNFVQITDYDLILRNLKRKFKDKELQECIKLTKDAQIYTYIEL